VNIKEILEYTKLNKERLLRAAALKQPDQVPIWAICEGLCYFKGIKDEYDINLPYFFPDVLFEQMHYYWKKYRGLVPITPEFNHSVEPSAFGCISKWSYNKMAYEEIIPSIRTPEDVQRMEVPDPNRSGLMPVVLNVYRYFKKKHPELPIKMPSRGRGPFTLASLITGGLPATFSEECVRLLQDWMEKKPEIVHELMEKCTQTIISWFKAQREVAEENFEIFIADDNSSYMTVDQYRKFNLPYLRKIFKELEHPLNMYHNCHQGSHLIELIAETGTPIFHMGTAKTYDYAEVKRRIGARICLCGYMDFQENHLLDRQTIENAFKGTFRDLGQGGGFVFTIGIRWNTSEEKFLWALEAVDKYGKYGK